MTTPGKKVADRRDPRAPFYELEDRREQDDRRTNGRARELVDRMLERLDDLEQQRAGDRAELLELAALIGRISAAIDLEELEDADEVIPCTAHPRIDVTV